MMNNINLAHNQVKFNQYKHLGLIIKQNLDLEEKIISTISKNLLKYIE